MDIKKFRLFVDIAETKNFTRSGERMGYTQSGVSHILKSLETDMGFPLFIRNKQGVRLTQNAEVVLPLVRSLLSKYEILEQTVSDLKGLETGRLVIATYSSISVNWMPRIIHCFREIYPGIDISLMEGGADDILGWLNDDIADFGFVSHRNMESLEWISLCDDPLMAVLPVDYPPLDSGFFPIKEFEGKCFIISAMGTDYDIHYALEDSGVRPEMRFSTTDDHTIIAMVANKLGISILPQLMLSSYNDQISSYLLEPYYSRNLGIAIKSKGNMSPAAAKFIEITRKVLPELL